VCSSNRSDQSFQRMKIVLQIRGLSEVPSFKNQKQIVKMGGKVALITKPERRKWMDRAALSIAFQLSSELATRGIGTSTAPPPLSLIASLMPLDDSRKWIPELCVSTLLVSKGEEGADIVIERIDGHQTSS